MQGLLTSLNLAQALATAGESAERLEDLWKQLWRQQHMPPRLLELCRLKLARMHDAINEFGVRHPAALNDGLADAQVAAIISSVGAESPDFSSADRAVLYFCEMYAIDAQSITDELGDAVKGHFGEPGLMALVEALGFIDGRIRMALVFQSLQAS